VFIDMLNIESSALSAESNLWLHIHCHL